MTDALALLPCVILQFVFSDIGDIDCDEPVCVLWLCRSVMLDRAETLLHDHYAGKDYWDVSEVMKPMSVLIIIMSESGDNMKNGISPVYCTVLSV